jgi:hypothetical protein
VADEARVLGGSRRPRIGATAEFHLPGGDPHAAPGNDPSTDRYDPDRSTDEYVFLSRPGMTDIQIELFHDYRTNVEAYGKWQQWLRAQRPRTMVLWGRYDTSFQVVEAETLTSLLRGSHGVEPSGDDGVVGLGQSQVGVDGVQESWAGVVGGDPVAVAVGCLVVDPDEGSAGSPVG